MNELLLKNASEKIEREKKSTNINEPSTLIQNKVAEALNYFCKQNSKLAEAIIKSDKTFAECCDGITKDCKVQRYISDEEAYMRAVKFYLPDAEIAFNMEIKTENDLSKINFTDFLKV